MPQPPAQKDRGGWGGLRDGTREEQRGSRVEKSPGGALLLNLYFISSHLWLLALFPLSLPLLSFFPSHFLSSQIASFSPQTHFFNQFSCLTHLSPQLVSIVSLSFCFFCVLQPPPTCLPPPPPPPGRSPLVAVRLSISGPPVPCTCHCAQPFDKSREGQTEFCRTRQSLNIWLPCPQVLRRVL